jgi:arabinan endo-1,5-alpha-L-arabinosidase
VAGGARIGRLAAALVLGVGIAVAVVPLPAAAAAPAPVYVGAQVADPGVVRTGGKFYAFATGSRAPVFRGDTAGGGWKRLAKPALASVPGWATDGGVWAPSVTHTSAGWVMYFALAAKGFGGQRCVGTATAKAVTGPYHPAARPLVCPGGRDGAHDTVPGRPVAGAGVIDPAPFQHTGGRRFLVYKTQRTPSSIRLLRLDAAGTDWTGTASGELLRDSGIVENPQLVQRGSTFVLFTSRYGWNSCGYDTAYYLSTDLRDFHHAAQHDLTTRSSTGGLCGPGGASVTTSLDGGWRIFLAAWVCTGTSPCTTTQGVVPKTARRVLYAAVLNWNGATPSRGEFL